MRFSLLRLRDKDRDRSRKRSKNPIVPIWNAQVQRDRIHQVIAERPIGKSLDRHRMHLFHEPIVTTLGGGNS